MGYEEVHNLWLLYLELVPCFSFAPAVVPLPLFPLELAFSCRAILLVTSFWEARTSAHTTLAVDTKFLPLPPMKTLCWSCHCQWKHCVGSCIFIPASFSLFTLQFLAYPALWACPWPSCLWAVSVASSLSFTLGAATAAEVVRGAPELSESTFLTSLLRPVSSTSDSLIRCHIPICSMAAGTISSKK